MFGAWYSHVGQVSHSFHTIVQTWTKLCWLRFIQQPFIYFCYLTQFAVPVSLLISILFYLFYLTFLRQLRTNAYLQWWLRWQVIDDTSNNLLIAYKTQIFYIALLGLTPMTQPPTSSPVVSIQLASPRSQSLSQGTVYTGLKKRNLQETLQTQPEIA